MSETLAYLAGLVDGEGYIGIKKARRKDAVSAIYHERIQVRMIHEGSIKLLADTLGGSYYRETMAQRRGRPLFCYQASDALAADILRKLLPYLVIKRSSAETVLKLRDSKSDPLARRRGSPARRTMDPSVLTCRNALYERCKALNHGTAI